MRTLTEIGDEMIERRRTVPRGGVYLTEHGIRNTGDLLAEALELLSSTVSMKSTADAISRIVRSYKGEGK